MFKFIPVQAAVTIPRWSNGFGYKLKCFPYKIISYFCVCGPIYVCRMGPSALVIMFCTYWAFGCTPKPDRTQLSTDFVSTVDSAASMPGHCRYNELASVYVCRRSPKATGLRATMVYYIHPVEPNNTYTGVSAEALYAAQDLKRSYLRKISETIDQLFEMLAP